MASASRRAAATMLWLLAAAAVATSETGEGGEAELGCFCDCMKNRCMTLGGAAGKLDCAAACNEACTQLGEPGQTRDDDFCGF